MKILCFLGLHKWKSISVIFASHEHDWYAHVFGNTVIHKKCDRCGMHGKMVGYDPL